MGAEPILLVSFWVPSCKQWSVLCSLFSDAGVARGMGLAGPTKELISCALLVRGYLHLFLLEFSIRTGRS